MLEQTGFGLVCLIGLIGWLVGCLNDMIAIDSGQEALLQLKSSPRPSRR
jgi:hypothetical protein